MSIAPFPPPSPELCQEFGKTAYYAQKLERELKLFLLACHLAGRIHLDIKSALTAEDFLSKKTLGSVYELLLESERRHGYPADSNFHELLEKAVEDRNFLAHQFFQTHDPLRSTSEQQRLMIERLGHIQLAVGNAYLVMREGKKKAQAVFGIREEDLESMLREFEGGSR